MALRALVLLAALAAGTHAFSFGLDCLCSPSTRGYSAGSMAALRDSRAKIHVLLGRKEADMKHDTTITISSIGRRVHAELIQKWDACVRLYNMEACVNADAAMRLSASCRPNCDSFCSWDRKTNKNLHYGRPANTCSGPPPATKPAAPARPAPPPPPRRTAAPVPKPAAADPAAARAPAAAPKSGAASDTSAAAAASDPQPDAGSSDVRCPEGSSSSECTNATPPRKTPSPVGTSSLEGTPEPEPRNEGCVAVEHLEGYVLQHAAPLRRSVLCAHGFCATPNHAIIVGGKLTSMRVLCGSEWKCVRSVKMVNNLKLAANRRAKVSELVMVTPYDLRFPKAAVWVVQIAEDVMYIVVAGVVAAAAAFVAMSVQAKVSL